ncbi:MAG: acyl-CoA dehydrogenase family protein [Parachlamydiaceae bacterium]
MTLTEKEQAKQEIEPVLTEASSGNKEMREALEVTEEARQREWLKQTFAGNLFVGNFDPSSLFPFPEQSQKDKEEGDKIIEPLMDYLAKHLDPEEVDRSREIPKEVIQEMGRMGIFALKIPKEYGGLGFSQTNYNRLVLRVASYCGATAVLISAHQSIGVPQPVKLYGTEAQKRKFLPMFRQGKISAFALTELDVGSDPARMTSEAKLSDDGSHYILNGTKLWCTNGTIADVIVVMAKTAPKIVKGKEKQQISAFILEMNTPGVEVVQRCEFMGLGGIYNGMLKFTNVKIPKENLLWEEGRGLALALGTINVGRLTLPAACTGAAKQCLSIVRRFGEDRVQWGLPIGLHEAGREKISYIAATTLAMEAMTWLTSDWADKGDIDIRIEAAMAKLFTTEELWKIVDMTMQIRGGRGYEKGRSLRARGEVPYPVERMMRDCRINRILEGTSEIMKLFLAREAMDPHLKRLAPLLSGKTSLMDKIKTAGSAFWFYLKWFPKQKFPFFSIKRYPEAGNLESHFRFIQKSSHQMAAALFEAMAKYQQKLEKRQLLLGRLVEIGTDLFAMSCCIAYAVHLNKKNPKDAKSLELADYFCNLATRRIQKRFSKLNRNIDRQSNQIAEQVIKKDYTWLEQGVQWMGPKE